MRSLRRVALTFVLLGCGAFFVLATASWYYGGADGKGCARCHEIRPMVDSWAGSTHRAIPCKDCHGSSLSTDLRMHAKNLQRVWLHARGQTPEQIHIRHQDVGPLIERCARCHRLEAADWRSGPHGITYATIFADPEHNARQRLMDDCLRCHAMHYEGGIRDLVTPIDRKGPWAFVHAEDAERPAIPCLACHSVHQHGEPVGERGAHARPRGRDQRITRPSLGLYDRRALDHVALASLPMPAMKDGGRSVKISPDTRQALCYQCHAPLTGMQVFSGDDRTPVGVHEGLSCLACHAGHLQTTRASCADCHPRLSNCGLDVETMDTTFRSEKSAHDIHRVACRDCHPKGVPKHR